MSPNGERVRIRAGEIAAPIPGAQAPEKAWQPTSGVSAGRADGRPSLPAAVLSDRNAGIEPHSIP